MPRTTSLINLRVSSEKKIKYAEASAIIGVSISEICRKALDNAVILAETLKTQKPKEAKPGVGLSESHTTYTGGSSAINTKGVFIRKGEEWVEKNETGA